MNGKISPARALPCWQEVIGVRRKEAQDIGDFSRKDIEIEEPEVFLSLVVPAFNEENRLGIMLTEAVDYLQLEYGRAKSTAKANGISNRTNGTKDLSSRNHLDLSKNQAASSPEPKGWEILVVSDGSTDKTTETALNFARHLGSGLSSSIRVVSLQKNRGKGGAVTHGMRHVRGQYVLFADADGASKFEDLGKLLEACKKARDGQGRAVAVGSRAHLVGSEAVIKVRTFPNGHQAPGFSQLTRFVLWKPFPFSFKFEEFLLNSRPAHLLPQLANVLLSSAHPPSYPSRHRRHPRHSMRL